MTGPLPLPRPRAPTPLAESILVTPCDPRFCACRDRLVSNSRFAGQGVVPPCTKLVWADRGRFGASEFSLS
jgi:hypothetical protein